MRRPYDGIPSTWVFDMRIALVADSHVSPRAPECVSNWAAAAEVVDRLGVDLTVHLGDITLDGERHPGELDFAAGLLQAWPTPMRCLPGNHDMGTGCGEEPISESRLRRYRETLGPDRWIVRREGWTLIGLNAQLAGSAAPAEAQQWSWLETETRALSEQDRAVLFLHRPLLRVEGDSAMPSGRYLGLDQARRLLEGPLGTALQVVVSGHTHQSLAFAADGRRHVWVPSSAFVIPDELQAPVGEKVVGLGLLTLSPGTARYERVSPPGMRRHELTALACFEELALRE